MSAENISYDLKRFAGIKRDYTPDEVERLRGSIKIEYSMCKHQSIKLWNLINFFASSNTFRGPPKPASPSAIIGNI